MTWHRIEYAFGQFRSSVPGVIFLSNLLPTPACLLGEKRETEKTLMLWEHCSAISKLWVCYQLWNILIINLRHSTLLVATEKVISISRQRKYSVHPLFCAVYIPVSWASSFVVVTQDRRGSVLYWGDGHQDQLRFTWVMGHLPYPLQGLSSVGLCGFCCSVSCSIELKSQVTTM